MPDDQHAEAAADGAVFAPIRVGGSRRGRLAAILAIAGMAGLIAIGALDRVHPAPQGATVVDASVPAAATPAPQTKRSSRPPPRGSLGPGNEHGSAAEAPITLDVQLADAHVFVHGEAFSLDVARVTVRIEESAGHTAATSSVDLPGGSTAFRIGAVPRFEVHFVLADEIRAHGFIVSATALDLAGNKLATIDEPIAGVTEITGPHADPAAPSPVVVEMSESEALRIQAIRRTSIVAIQGQVFAQEAQSVVFRVRTLDGDVADSITRPVPAMLADGRNNRPSWPLAVELALPSGLASTALVIEAEVYGPGGARIDLIRVRLIAEI